MTTKSRPIPPVSPQPEPAPAGAEPAAVAPTEPELQQLREQAAKAAENWDRFLRAAAELENYRKRVAREKEETARYAREQVVAALLPVLDNLERAMAAAGPSVPDQSGLMEGIRQTQAQFRRALEEFGLEEVVAHAGHPFDPRLHEAVSQEESDEHPDGTILNQLQRGYKIANRLLRPARVVVSKGPAEEPPADAAS